MLEAKGRKRFNAERLSSKNMQIHIEYTENLSTQIIMIGRIGFSIIMGKTEEKSYVLSFSYTIGPRYYLLKRKQPLI